MARIARSYWQWVDPGMAEDLHQAELDAWQDHEAQTFIEQRIDALTERFILMEQYEKQGMTHPSTAHAAMVVARQCAQWLRVKAEMDQVDWSVEDRNGLRPVMGSPEYKTLAHQVASIDLVPWLTDWRTLAQANLHHFATRSDTTVNRGGRWPDKKMLRFYNKCIRALETEMYRVAKVISDDSWLPRTFTGDEEAKQEEE